MTLSLCFSSACFLALDNPPPPLRADVTESPPVWHVICPDHDREAMHGCELHTHSSATMLTLHLGSGMSCVQALKAYATVSNRGSFEVAFEYLSRHITVVSFGHFN